MNSTAVCTHRIIIKACQWLSYSLSACSQGHSLPHCPAMLYTQWVGSCKWHIPGSCAYWFSDGFIRWETLSRAQGQEKQRGQAILLSFLFQGGVPRRGNGYSRCLFLPGSLVSLANSQLAVDSAFSIALGFLQLLHSGYLRDLWFSPLTPLQLFPCTKFPFLV